LWFQPTKAGTYHLFCAEYCGTKHSGMIGRVIVQEPRDYEEWLASGRAGATLPATRGEELFTSLACVTCHADNTTERGPSLVGLFGRTVQTQGGRVLADDTYLRESILSPGTRVVSGFQPLMPPYQGQLSEEDVMSLIAYIKTLRPGTLPAQSAAGTTPQRAGFTTDGMP
jgi:cytochrome c oxidase subunit 2